MKTKKVLVEEFAPSLGTGVWDRALAVIRRKLDPNWIEERTQGKQTFRYITATKAVELLNEAFEVQNWSLNDVTVERIESVVTRFKGYGEDKKEVQVTEYNFLAKVELSLAGRLVIGVGTCSAEWNQLDTAYKGAVSDAFKKALWHLGFFMELYPDSTDNPDVWKKQNKEAGTDLRLGELGKLLNAPISKLAAEFSWQRWGAPIYHTAEQVASMHPDYIREFMAYLEAKIELEGKPTEAK